MLNMSSTNFPSVERERNQIHGQKNSQCFIVAAEFVSRLLILLLFGASGVES
jgi:hypothetical protein